MAKVSFRGFHKSYGKTQVVKGVDLEIKDGEFLVIVGPSGCGKSTLLRTLAGLEDATKGEIFIGDRKVNDLKPKDRDIAMVFQSYALYPHMTVRENMSFGLRIRKMDPAKIEKAVSEAAKLLDLTELLDRFPKAMSGGQRQRVAMGRAIVRKPAVFLFDEPLSNLDAKLRHQMRVELKRLHQRLGSTMLYVTHDQIEAMTLADRIALIDKGLIQQVGTPDELYSWPANKFTASFLGSPSMNFFEGELQGTVFKAEGVELLVDPTILAKQVDASRRVILGVRPHDLYPAEKTEKHGLRAVVDLTEPLGWETLVHVKLNDLPFVARFESAHATKIQPGDEILLQASPKDVRLFDVETEEALCRCP